MKRQEYMSNEQRTQMGNLPRTHQNCFDKTGVKRPGKTAQDNARRGRR